MSRRPPGVLLYFDILPALRLLSQAEKGALFEAILEYGEFGAIPDFEGSLGVAWAFIQPRLEADLSNYADKCQKAANSANKRWGKDGKYMPQHASACAGMPKDTNLSTTPTAKATSPTATSSEAKTEGEGGAGETHVEPPDTGKDFDSMRQRAIRMLETYK